MVVLDKYELLARIAPTVLVVSPLPICAWGVLCTIPSDLTTYAAGSVFTLAVAYALSFWVRAMGKGVEVGLWEAWGGPPSTAIVRWDDSTLSGTEKLGIRAAVQAAFGIDIGDRQPDSDDASATDARTAEAFRAVREYLRRECPDGLWHARNIEYGFLRNVLGARLLWLAMSLASFVAILFACWFRGWEMSCGSGPLVLAGITLVLCLVVGWGIAPSQVRGTATAYAVAAWSAFVERQHGDGRGR